MILTGFHSISKSTRWGIVGLILFSIPIFGQNKSEFQHFNLKIWQLQSQNPYLIKSHISETQTQNLMSKELNRFLNNGFPFCKIQVDTLNSNVVTSLFATIDPGPAVENGPIILEADSGIDTKMLSRWLRFKRGQPFSVEKFNRINVLLRQLPMAEVNQAPKLEWFGEKAVLHLNLVKRRINSFTGILGILPQTEGAKPIITGNIDASLQNIFGQALALDLKWNRFAPSSQTAQVKILQEAIGYNGLALEALFDLFRQDSLLNRQRLEFRLITSPGGVWKYKVGFQTVSSSSNFGPTQSSFQKISTQSLTFSVDYEPFPFSGISLKHQRFGATFRPTLKQFEANEQKNEVPQLEALLSFSWPIPLKTQRFAIQTSTELAGVWSEKILVPDQFRVGGNQTIRGFNENQFFTSQHGIFTFQPRYLLDKTLLINVFAQAMAYNPNTVVATKSNFRWAYSFGTGIELEVNKNLVQISLASGFSKEIPLDFQTSKIHFGYVARF